MSRRTSLVDDDRRPAPALTDRGARILDMPVSHWEWLMQMEAAIVAEDGLVLRGVAVEWELHERWGPVMVTRAIALYPTAEA